MCQNRRLDLEWRHPEPSNLETVVEPPNVKEKAFVVGCVEVAGAHPTVAQGLLCQLVAMPVSCECARTVDPQVTGFAPCTLSAFVGPQPQSIAVNCLSAGTRERMPRPI